MNCPHMKRCKCCAVLKMNDSVAMTTRTRIGYYFKSDRTFRFQCLLHCLYDVLPHLLLGKQGQYVFGQLVSNSSCDHYKHFALKFSVVGRLAAVKQLLWLKYCSLSQLSQTGFLPSPSSNYLSLKDFVRVLYR